MKKKLVIFHPAIAPYRIDFFNSLNKEFNAKFYFEYGDVLEQSFKQDELKCLLDFQPNFLAPGFLGIKNLRLQVLSILKKEKPDIIFCCEYNILGFLVLLYKYLFNHNVRVVTICDDSKDIAIHDKGFKRVFRSILVKLYSGIILTNNEVISWYTDTYQIKEKLLFLPIVQDDNVFRKKLNEALPISEQIVKNMNLVNKQLILYVGRLIDIKNLIFLLYGFSQLIQRYPNVVLLLVGDGDQRFLLEQEVERLRITDRVFFVGKKEGSELYAYYNIGHVFVLPSYYERFGAVVNEALLSGCYTLCSKLAGASCLITENRNGDIFDPYNVKEFTYKLDEYLSKIEPLKQISLKPNRMDKEYSVYMKDLLTKLNVL